MNQERTLKGQLVRYVGSKEEVAAVNERGGLGERD
jgi:hypothetical protein